MKSGYLAVVLAGCASGQAAQAPDAASGAADAKVYRDGRIEPQGDAPHVTPTDAAVDGFVFQDACVPVATELLVNPVFDLAPKGTGWQQTPIDALYPPITDDVSSTGAFVAQSMPYKAWLGGFVSAGVGQNATDAVYQDVVVPAGTTQVVLTGVYQVGTDETISSVYDRASLALVQVNGTPIESVVSLSNLTTTGGAWVAISHTFATALAGQTVRLRLTSSNDFSNATSFVFDTLSLKATRCP